MFGSLLGFAGNLLGGLFGKSNADKQMEMQEQFAQQGLTWKAADARRAEKQYGINPLVSMGANTVSYSPVAVGDTVSAMGSAGQDLGRAVDAYRDRPSRLDDLNAKLLEAKIANVNSDTVRNQAVASSMAVRAQPGATPGVPIPRDDPRPPLAFKAYRDMNGQTMWAPTADFSQAIQNNAALPLAASIGARSIYYGPYGAPSDVRGDAWRNAMPLYQPGG